MAKSKKPQQPGLPGTQFPDWWPMEAWRGFMDMRKAIKAPLTDYAVNLMVRKMTDLRASGNDPCAVFDQSIVKCYTDIYPLKDRWGQNSAVVAFEQTSLAGWLNRLELFYSGGSWSTKWGGKPPAKATDMAHPDCKCPKEAFTMYLKAHGGEQQCMQL